MFDVEGDQICQIVHARRHFHEAGKIFVQINLFWIPSSLVTPSTEHPTNAWKSVLSTLYSRYLKRVIHQHQGTLQGRLQRLRKLPDDVN